MKCKLCGLNNTKEFIVKNKSWEKKYHKCLECSFISLESNLVMNDREQFIRYNMHNNKVDDPVYRNYFKKFINYAFEYAENKKKVLDFGSGPEPVLGSVLKSMGYEVSIYDKFFASNVKVLEDKYEIITATEVFEHLEYPREYFKKLINILEDNGLLILMTCFHSDDLKKFSEWWYIQDPTHISFYDMKTFNYISDEFNLEIVADNNKNIVILRKMKC